MNYPKVPLAIDQQADLLISRGLVADREELISCLSNVNYYRLSGYLYPYRQQDAGGLVMDNFVPGTAFDQVWQRYRFDVRLRAILMEAIEQVEVSLRTRLVYRFVQAHGPFGHLDPTHFPGMAPASVGQCPNCNSGGNSEHEAWISALSKELNRSREGFVRHFLHKYGDSHSHLPLWMGCELMTFGTMLRMLTTIEKPVRVETAKSFGFPEEMLVSWAKCLQSLRNDCAHHARILRRVFGVNASIPSPNKHPKWRERPGDPKFSDKRAWMHLCVVHYWLGKITDTSGWKSRLYQLFDDFPHIGSVELGMPANWRTHPLWQ